MGNSGSKLAREQRLAKEWGYDKESEGTAHCCYFRVYHADDGAVNAQIEAGLEAMDDLQNGTLRVTARNEKRTLVSYGADEAITEDLAKKIKAEIKNVIGDDAKVSWVLKNAEQVEGEDEDRTEIAHETENV